MKGKEIKERDNEEHWSNNELSENAFEWWRRKKLKRKWKNILIENDWIEKNELFVTIAINLNNIQAPTMTVAKL